MISVAVLTKDEELNIRECLESVSWADEIIIVDDNSKDNTRDICKTFKKTTIYQHQLMGFGEQRQFAIDKAKGDWILFIDADERVTPQLMQEIQGAITCTSHDAFALKQKAFYCGKEIKHCNWSCYTVRLFRKGKGRSDMRSVHEKILIDGDVDIMKSPILHYSYRSISHHIFKMNLYTDLEAESLYRKGLRIRTIDLLKYWCLKPLIAFLRKYIFMKGILDGREGFLISVFTSWVVFLSYVKLWDIQSKRKEL